MQIIKIGKKFDVGVRLISSKTAGTARKTQSQGNHSAQSRLEVDPDYPSYFMPPDSRKTIVVKCLIADHCIMRVAFSPTYINGQSQPHVLSADDPRSNQVIAYMEEITRNQGLNTRYPVQDNQVLIEG